jgi:dihydrofolate synthase/folylpolyglutamate synthase
MSTGDLNPERAYLDSLAFFGIKLGLENIAALLDAAGNPHHGLDAIHVAGTNGKGSVLAFLDAMFREAGYTTGRFTSPHLIDVNERFLLNAQPIADSTLDAQIARFRGVAESLGRTPTYFELCTGIAFQVFHDAKVDAALIETGMGGRLDSTNVVAPLATAITGIALDHMQYLGDTLEAIAAEKAGIIKPGRPVIVGRMAQGPLEVILAQARAVGAPALVHRHHFDAQASGPALRPMFRYDSPTLELGPVPLGLPGKHQADNAAVACALAMELQTDFPALIPDAIMRGLMSARWPCRLERVCDSPTIIIDAAHNPHGMAHYAGLFREAVVLFACSSDKDATGMLDTVAQFARPLIVTQYDGPRAADAQQLAAQATCEARAIPNLADALAEAIQLATDRKPLLITGSIFLAGEARRLLTEQQIAPPLQF